MLPVPVLAGGWGGPQWSLSASEALGGRGVTTHRFPDIKPFSSPI